MTAPSTISLVVRRALANPAPVVSVAINVLVVCTLVSGLAASLGLLQKEALGGRFAAAEPDATVLAVTSPYEEEEPARQEQLVRDALQPLTAVSGGGVVTVAESGSYRIAGRDATATFAAVTGDQGRLRLTGGRLPAGSSDGPLEVAAAEASGLAEGDRLALVNQADGRRVRAVVVGTWDTAEDGPRWLGGLDPTTLVLAPERFAEVAGAGNLVRWRAVPDLARLEPDQLPQLVTAVAAARTEVEAAGEKIPASVQLDTELPEELSDRARELTVLRALLLVPAGLLLLVAGAGLLLVAAGLADVRREEESLLRSRGAGYRQLAGPTVVETVLLCGIAAAVAPLLARMVVRIGDVRSPLEPAAWLASAVAAAACAVALTVPVLVRAVTGDRGQQLSAEKQRRRLLTGLVASTLLVVAVGALAVVELRDFGDSVAGTTVASAGVDPLLVASPALLLLAVSVVAAVVLLPLWFRLVVGVVGGRGVAPALGTRFAARAPAAAIPVALAVSLASGTIAFAAVERTSSAEARDARASYVAGADVRVTTPPEAQRAGVDAERRTLTGLPGVTDATPLHRGDSFVDDLPAQVLMTDLSAATAAPLLGGHDAWREAVAPPWQDPSTGVAIPPGTDRLRISVAGTGSGPVAAWVAGPDGEVGQVPATSRRGTAVFALPPTLAEGSRLLALRTGADVLPDEAADGAPRVTVLADGEPLEPSAEWANPGRLVLVTFGQQPTLPTGVPAVLTEDLATDASLSVGDTVTFPVFGIPTPVEVVATVPSLRTVADGSGGVLLDSATALPYLLAAGFTEPPGEWWLEVAPAAEERVADELLDHPQVAAHVVTRGEVVRQLDDDPSTGGAALGQVLVLTGIGCLLVGALLLFSVVLLRRRERADQARMMTAAGADRGDLVGVLTWEYSLIAGSGLAVGVLAGVGVAATTLVSMTLGPDGRLLVPRPELALPWATLLLLPAAMVAVPLVAMAWLAWRDHGRALETAQPGRGDR